MAKVASIMGEIRMGMMRMRMRMRMRRMTMTWTCGTRMSLFFMTLKYQVFLIGTCLAKTSSVKLQL